MKFNLTFFLREALRTMRRNAAPTFAALATVTVTLVVIGVFIPIVQAAQGSANSVRGRVLVNAYMEDSATHQQDLQTKQKLLALPHVRRVRFESKAQALAIEKKLDPQAYAIVTSNPLPDTWHVRPTNPADALLVRHEIMHATAGGRTYKVDSAIAKVSNHVQDTKKVLTVTKFVTIGAAALALLLMLASVLLIANTIRLSLFARRREVEVMKLVGATDWFIRWPFVIEGTIVGATGAICAVILLGIGKFALLDPIVNNVSLVSSPQTISFVALLVVLIGAGVVVSAVGSGLSLRRFLRV